MVTIVLGGGPAGCFASMHSAKSGQRTVLYEEHGEIGKPIQCSGLVSKKGLDSLGIDYSKSILNRINGSHLHFPGVSLRVESPETKAYVIDRSVFDCLCADAAISEGVDIKTGVSRAGSGQEDVIIGADGVFSRTARENGFPDFKKVVSCYQEEFAKATPTENNMVSVYISRNNFPGFFGWVIPINEERVRVGLGVSFGKNPREYFNGFRKTLGKNVLKNAKRESWLGGCIPLAPRNRTVKGNVMLVGDAAGQVKAVSGGGIYFGCTCASIAGKVAALNKNDLLLYERVWRRKLSRDMRIHGFIRNALDAFPGEVTGTVAYASKFLGAENFLVRYGDMDRPTQIARAMRDDSMSYLSKRFNTIYTVISSII